MFPLRDTVRPRLFPFITYGLIILCVLAFLLEMTLGFEELSQFVSVFGVVPAELNFLQPVTLIGLITSIFLHGSWIHLISNMWALFIFGDNVEDRMGHIRYLAFFLIGGVVASLVHVVISNYILGPGSVQARVPLIGASGSIAAVLGAYFYLYPRARIVTFIPWIVLPPLVELPAIVYLGVWFLMQLYPGLRSLGTIGEGGGVAWWAHIGGFIFGLLVVRAFSRPRRLIRQEDEEDDWWL